MSQGSGVIVHSDISASKQRILIWFEVGEEICVLWTDFSWTRRVCYCNPMQLSDVAREIPAKTYTYCWWHNIAKDQDSFHKIFDFISG